MNEEELTDALHAAEPPRPDVTAWADASRGRARNRRVAGVAVAVLLAAGIAVPLALQLPGRSGPVVLTTPSPTTSASATESTKGGQPLVPEVCADVQSGTAKPGTLSANQRLEPGAARVWLCGDVDGSFGGGAIGPIEPLTSEPDRVVAAINELPPSETDFCYSIGGLTYHVVVDYPDGTRRVLAAETVNCEFVGGWGGRTGGRALLETLEGFWDEQRASEPPFTDDADLCGTYPRGYEEEGGLSSFLPVERGSLVRGAVCGLSADSVDFTGETIQRDLPETLVSAIATASPPAGESYRLARGLPYVVLLNEHGDPVTYAVDEKQGLILRDGQNDATPWQPQGEMAALWSQVLDGLRTSAFYSAPAECETDHTLTPAANLGQIVAGWACVDAFAVPAEGPMLDPVFAQQLARRFDAEAAAATTGSFNTANELMLQDSDGNLSPLWWNGELPVVLVDEGSKRAWTVPDDVVEELRTYGLEFQVDG